MLTTTTTPVARGWCVAPHGDLDLATAPALREELLRRLRQGDVVLDLGGVGFLDSSGLHALMASHRRATLMGRRFCVAGARAGVLTVLRLTQVVDVLDLHPDRASALRALDPHGRVPAPTRPAPPVA
ncbi:anti-sigma factor antagonist [Vallicoccus soli]|uniref:Anti-sigma factor antagonist n=1 Tax=Vallicoccus soli TaxID=2339232 RepID=A0A3A3Z5T4_9ACTN|nr:anti-sigma factor antagonist [Vallicoccus soli]